MGRRFIYDVCWERQTSQFLIPSKLHFWTTGGRVQPGNARQPSVLTKFRAQGRGWEASNTGSKPLRDSFLGQIMHLVQAILIELSRLDLEVSTPF
jgi:hypothetical protein